MQITFADKKLQESLQDKKERQRRFGPEMAKKTQLRLEALSAALSLGAFWPAKSGPERCHELLGDLAGTFSMDVKQPYRLLFVPSELPKDTPLVGKPKWDAIKAIKIIAIEDTHG